MDHRQQGQAVAPGILATECASAVPQRSDHDRLSMLGLSLLAFAVRAPGLLAGFVFDDAWGMQQHFQVRWSNIPSFFTTDGSAFFGSNFYRPFLSVCYQAVYALAGSRPWGWHLASILLHVACTLLVFRLARAVIGTPRAAALAAALFAVHPAHVEAISWASALADPLWTALMLASVLAFLRWMQRGSALWFVASLLAGGAAIFTKETAVVLPFVLLATVLAMRPSAGNHQALPWRAASHVVTATVPFFALSALFLYLRHLVLHSFSHPLTVASDRQMLLTWPAAMLFYLRHMFWPPAVVPFYPLAMVQSWSAREVLLPLLGLIAISAVLLYLLCRAGGWRKTLLCLAWTLFPLAPALYLKAFAPFELVHDRLLYAPLVGFCMAAALVLHRAAERVESVTHFRAFTILCVALIPLLAIESMSQAVWWQNNKTLFARAITVTPNNPKALANLAGAYLVERRVDDAAPLLQRAIQIAPHDSVVLYGMSLLSSMQGHDAAAERYIVEALRLSSRYDLWLQLAAVELRLKKLDVAEAAARQAMKMNFEAEGVHVALGAILLAKGDARAATPEFQYELHNYPNNETAREGLAQAKAMQSR